MVCVCVRVCVCVCVCVCVLLIPIHHAGSLVSERRAVLCLFYETPFEMQSYFPHECSSDESRLIAFIILNHF